MFLTIPHPYYFISCVEELSENVSPQCFYIKHMLYLSVTLLFEQFKCTNKEYTESLSYHLVSEYFNIEMTQYTNT